MADIIQIQTFCLSLPEVVESFPFDETTLVFKVRNKMLALIPLERDPQVMLKCHPDLAEEWRLRFPEVIPAWHMNKKHWNSVLCDGGLSWERIQKMILHSYCMVVHGLPKKDQKELSDQIALAEYAHPQL
ncbi:MAG: MmcQ/YjbR family DNA-binding protein [Bacteroidales bacterium]|nr:MmcQ/YjbR family DNA-binding protein [Porphyromonas sp.]MDD6935032.1 MmcQ/YjbR family DNA-binding protein [Bacteroidales bacterium]MDY3102640.1 MmcQ/YjbR family DNA-binding protein [Porphyromonas sp.]